MAGLDDIAAIETPEQVELELRLANVGSRASAFILDSLIQLVFIVVLAFVLFAGLGFESHWSKDDQRLGRLPSAIAVVITLAMFVVNVFYFSIFELLWNGQSPGKRALKLRVLRDTGHGIDARASFIRNLARMVDVLPSLYTLGILTIFFDGKHRRVGDMAAGTLVVRDEKPADALDVAAVNARHWPAWMTIAEQELVADWLDRRALLPPSAAQQVAAKLAASLVTAHGLQTPADPVQFLLELAT
jgi:uncharacterized RDD family membrane protein YckC